MIYWMAAINGIEKKYFMQNYLNFIFQDDCSTYLTLTEFSILIIFNFVYSCEADHYDSKIKVVSQTRQKQGFVSD